MSTQIQRPGCYLMNLSPSATGLNPRGAAARSCLAGVSRRRGQAKCPPSASPSGSGRLAPRCSAAPRSSSPSPRPSSPFPPRRPRPAPRRGGRPTPAARRGAGRAAAFATGPAARGSAAFAARWPAASVRTWWRRPLPTGSRGRPLRPPAAFGANAAALLRLPLRPVSAGRPSAWAPRPCRLLAPSASSGCARQTRGSPRGRRPACCRRPPGWTKLRKAPSPGRSRAPETVPLTAPGRSKGTPPEAALRAAPQAEGRRIGICQAPVPAPKYGPGCRRPWRPRR
mmetsp:Transcript_81765/g.243851  ORF Transcript_81765/g.243851 Transcript_81765/m.243851 type:complete len:283 (-) Transcript_81765:278-1126(-)